MSPQAAGSALILLRDHTIAPDLPAYREWSDGPSRHRPA